jgi:hypothetical protein
MLLLLLSVPLQGMASAMHALACMEHGEATGAAAEHGHAAHDQHAGHDHGTAHQHPGDTDGTAEHASHQCCHHFSSAAAPSFGRAADIDLPVFQSSLSLLETLFFPEQPQRPPRG